MYCVNCGAAITPGTHFCVSCGKPVPGAPAQSAPQSVGGGAAAGPAYSLGPTATAMPAAPLSPELEKLRGVGGWLLVFCIVVTIIHPLINLAEAVATPQPGVIFLDLLLSAAAVTTGVSVWSKQSWAFTMVKAYFITMIVVAVLIFIGAATETNSQVQIDSFVTGIRVLVWVGIWWSYFRRSKRVLATFGRNA